MERLCSKFLTAHFLVEFYIACAVRVRGRLVLQPAPTILALFLIFALYGAVCSPHESLRDVLLRPRDVFRYTYLLTPGSVCISYICATSSQLHVTECIPSRLAKMLRDKLAKTLFFAKTALDLLLLASNSECTTFKSY